MRSGQFEALRRDDLALLFRHYDHEFFGARLGDTLLRLERPLAFRVSARMSRAGGKTYVRLDRAGRRSYEIAVSAPLLFQSFADLDRPVAVAGLDCRDRLDSLQRIFEHELVHLAELVAWEHSRCRAPRFRRLAAGFFGHRCVTHALITQAERARELFAIAPGASVAFELAGRRHTGTVQRITRRATVLVEDRGGALYTDGRRYLKFYVPLGALERRS